jgi:exodeoxyribonuclease VII small subunit
MKEEHQKFTPNYEELKQIAEHLRVQREVNIDELIPMIEKATKAYKICKNRLEEVKVALEQYMPQGAEEQPTS